MVQTIGSPAFAAGSDETSPGTTFACLSGGGTLTGGTFEAGRATGTLTEVTYSVETLCCDNDSVSVSVTVVFSDGDEVVYDFDRDLEMDCVPAFSCADCPTVFTGSVHGEGGGRAARLSFTFDNLDGVGQRGGTVDTATLDITQGSPDNEGYLRIHASGPVNGTEISCISC